MSKSEALQKLLSINEECLNVWCEIQKSIPENDNILSYEMLSKIVVRRDMIKLESSTQKFELEPMKPYFENIDNIFNDTFPEKEYFDLASRIRKFNVLMEDSVITILSEWEKLLSNVRDYLLKVQNKISEDKGFIERVRKLLDIPNDETIAILEMNDVAFKPSQVDYDFQCKSEEYDKIEHLRNFMYSFYRPIEFR